MAWGMKKAPRDEVPSTEQIVFHCIFFSKEIACSKSNHFVRLSTV